MDFYTKPQSQCKTNLLRLTSKKSEAITQKADQLICDQHEKNQKQTSKKSNKNLANK